MPTLTTESSKINLKRYNLISNHLSSVHSPHALYRSTKSNISFPQSTRCSTNLISKHDSPSISLYFPRDFAVRMNFYSQIKFFEVRIEES